MKTILRATSTPLASIFGSGFLVIVPILAGATGAYSVLAMVAVCAVAFAVGAVIRFNIRNAEPVLADAPGEATLSLERASDLALVLAYVISVCLYIHILAAFALGGTGVDSPFNENVLTTLVIAAITAIGVSRGLSMLDALEAWALYVTLGIIFLLLAGFAYYDWNAWNTAAGFTLVSSTEQSAWNILTIVAGTLIVVQGFETPRYMSDEFNTETRVLASRWSQIISTCVYLIFVAAALPSLHVLGGDYDDNSLVTLVGLVAGVLVMPLIIAAALSQFSAAVADTHAATGIMQEVTRGHLKARWGCLLVGLGAIALTWSANTLEILSLASRAFALYYFLQCLVAISVSESAGQRALIAPVAAVLLFITIFAVPAG